MCNTAKRSRSCFVAQLLHHPVGTPVQIIYDLLVKNSSPLELREDPELGVVVAGLKHITVTSAAEIMSLLEEGNRRRKTEATDANASSSRSHAVGAGASGGRATQRRPMQGPLNAFPLKLTS